MATNWGQSEVGARATGFWSGLNRAREFIQSGRRVDAAAVVREVISAAAVDRHVLGVGGNRWEILQAFVKTYRLPIEIPQFPTSVVKPGVSIDSCASSVIPGVSLVTCCMNRNENLVKAIPSWLACNEISEVVIVDWSSNDHVSEELEAAGIDDARIRIIRVEGEGRWILSYAFNVGFRMASRERILKVDADIVLDPGFFQKNELRQGEFLSGDWRIAQPGQEFINGFFYVFRDDLMKIKGFNEFITTYGWDDDDIYNRLQGSGIVRARVEASTIHHLPHDDAARIGGSTVAAECAWDELEADTRFKIRMNRFIANVMPAWDHGRVLLPFIVEKVEENVLTIRRSGSVPHAVPKHIQEDARYYAATELFSWKVGPRAFNLGRDRLERMLSSKRFEDLTKLDVEIAFRATSRDFRFSRRYLVLRVADSVKSTARKHLIAALDVVQRYSQRHGIPVIAMGDEAATLLEDRPDIPCVGSWLFESLETPRRLEPQSLHKGQLPLANTHFYVELADLVQSDVCADGEFTRAVASFITRPKLYVDAQHGLGNRLRAIASGAAIARATGREMIIVWQPDHHCECRFSDLFDYDNAVVEESFTASARTAGMQVFNYMEIEKHAAKDAALDLRDGSDVYFRSAYVASSEHTGWAPENEFLRSLKPARAVLALTEGVRQPNVVGVHVRMEAGQGLDHNSYDSQENWTKEGHEQLHYWRAQSHYSRFMNRIDQLDNDGLAPTIFLAADRPEIYQEFINRYGDRLAYLERDVYDRSREQIQYALADVLLLSRCERLLGSTWSSFSELALRLSLNFEAIEMSGKNF